MGQQSPRSRRCAKAGCASSKEIGATARAPAHGRHVAPPC
eukprot:gene8566-17791_t